MHGDRLGTGTAASEFLWGVGIENTFVPHTRAGHRRFDEYELMDHYGRWRQDLDLASDLGVSAIRYGIPWYRVEPEPGKFDWSWTDAVLEYLVEAKGLTPIIDLMHYGTPLWMDNHFVNASYPRRVAAYAAAFAGRYGSLVRYFTPLNEPGVTAAYCGRDGRWPPYLRGDDGWTKVLMNLAKGVVLTAEALRASRPDAVLVHVEDVGIERAATPDLAEIAEKAQARRLLPLDLACGKVRPGHSHHDWLIEHGATAADLEFLAARSPGWDVLGTNFYPWSNRRIARRRNGQVVAKTCPARPCLAEALRMVHDRYGLPVMVSETSAPGSHLDRARWMNETVAAVRSCRTSGVPVVGYVWFPMFTMIEWKYRWSRKGLEHHLLHLGLWDVNPQDGRLDRDATPLVESYRRLVAETSHAVGEWVPSHVLPEMAGLVA